MRFALAGLIVVVCVSTVAPKSGRNALLPTGALVAPPPPAPKGFFHGLGIAFPVNKLVGFGGGWGDVLPRVGGGGGGCRVLADKWLGLDGAKNEDCGVEV